MSLTWEQLRIERNDRAAVIGMTGCGKTTLSEYLLDDPNKKNCFVWDPKGSESIAKFHSKFRRCGSLTDAIDEAEDRGTERLIYTPTPLLAEDEDDQERMFAWIYARGFTRLYIDEATSLAGGMQPSRLLVACLNRGRERGVSVIVSSQRPARIPMNILSESQWFFIFQLNLLADRKRVEELTGISVESQTTLSKHEFFVWNASWPSGAYHKKVKLTLKG